MTSQSKNNRLLPLTVIEAAAGGELVEQRKAKLMAIRRFIPRRINAAL